VGNVAKACFGLTLGVNRLNPHQAHEPAHMVAADENAVLVSELNPDLPGSVKGHFGVDLVDMVHDLYVSPVHSRNVVEAGSCDVEEV